MWSRKPIPGYFYTNHIGQLIRVKLLVYVAGKVSRVIVEHLDNRLLKVTWEEWQEMGLSIYTEWHGIDSGKMEKEYEL